MNIENFIILVIIGLLAGIFSGLIGIGGGVIIIPALVFFLGFSPHLAQGTSLAIMIPPIGLLAVYQYYKSGNINWTAAIIIAISFFIGGYFGAKYSLRIPQDIIKKVFAVFLVLFAIKLFFNK